MTTLTVHWPINRKLDPDEPRLTSYIDIKDRIDTTELLFNQYYELRKNHDYHEPTKIFNIHNNNFNGIWDLL